MWQPLSKQPPDSEHQNQSEDNHFKIHSRRKTEILLVTGKRGLCKSSFDILLFPVNRYVNKTIFSRVNGSESLHLWGLMPGQSNTWIKPFKNQGLGLLFVYFILPLSCFLLYPEPHAWRGVCLSPAVISQFLKCLWGFLFMFHFLASPISLICFLFS